MTTTRPRTHRQGTSPPARDWSEFLFVPDLLFAVATLVALWLLDPGSGLAAISLIALLFAVTAALRRGGPYLLPSSVFFLAAGVFVGIAAFYLARVETDVAAVDLRNAAGLAMLSTLGVSIVVAGCAVGWKLKWPRSDLGLTENRQAMFHPPREWAIRAAAMVVISQVPITSSLGGAIATAIGLAGILMLTLMASTRRVKLRWAGDLVLVAVVVGAPLLWYYLEFQGGGRLMLAGLMVASFIGWNLVRPHRAQKIAVILAIPIFLLFAGMDRLDRGGGSASSSGVVTDGRGLASVYSPLETFGQIIAPKPVEKMELLGPRYGGTFVNTLILPVPRQFWEDKPIGFGRELVYALEVTGVGENHSMAALYHGEWYANFGYAGLAMLVPLTGFALAWLDRLHLHLVRGRLADGRSWWHTVALMCAVSSLADLYWVGSFMWFARGGLAMVVVLAIAMVSRRRVRFTRRVRRARSEPDPAAQAVRIP